MERPRLACCAMIRVRVESILYFDDNHWKVSKTRKIVGWAMLLPVCDGDTTVYSEDDCVNVNGTGYAWQAVPVLWRGTAEGVYAMKIVDRVRRVVLATELMA